MAFEKSVQQYLAARVPDARYASFDYCFNYFQSFRETGKPRELVAAQNLQASCLHLGFYLASWGMLRGSAALLQKSARHLVPIIEAIACADASFWEIDAHCYTEPNIRKLLDFRHTLLQVHQRMSDILITKIMLGVFGNVPAFDGNFTRGFGVSSFGPKALQKIAVFHDKNSAVIEKYRVATVDFTGGESTNRRYTRAKVIDMAFFMKGGLEGRNT